MARAWIDWVAAEDGGRQAPPPEGHTYWGVARFDNHEEAWSLAVVIRTPGDDEVSNADVSFLVKEAPRGLLTEGAEFYLYEGARHVATGVMRDSV